MSTIELPPTTKSSDHFVSTEPFDPGSATRLSPEQERLYLASQWKLMWWKFKLHRVAVVSGVILLAMYATTLVTDHPFHVALGSIAPQNGMGFGPALVTHYTPSETWRNQWSTDAVFAPGGAWRAGRRTSGRGRGPLRVP